MISNDKNCRKKSLKIIPRALHIPGKPVRNCIKSSQPVAKPNFELTSLDAHEISLQSDISEGLPTELSGDINCFKDGYSLDQTYLLFVKEHYAHCQLV